MNSRIIIIAALCAVSCFETLAETQEIDVALADLGEKLAVTVKEKAKKKVTVLDFTDLQGNPRGELGKYIAEQLTVDLVLQKRDFAVLDRANLRKILAEHKLTASGLVDPENAKKLGQFAGVDALILGTIIPRDNNITLTAKIITTDTAEIIGAARAQFAHDDAVKKLESSPPPAGGSITDKPNSGPSIVKSFGDLRVELQPLQALSGDQLMLTMVFTNRSSKRSIWVALNSDIMGKLKSTIIDSAGHEYHPAPNGTSGIQSASYQRYGYDLSRFSPATQIRPSDSITATIKFLPSNPTESEPGVCKVQVEFLLGRNFDSQAASVTVENLSTKIESE